LWDETKNEVEGKEGEIKDWKNFQKAAQRGIKRERKKLGKQQIKGRI